MRRLKEITDLQLELEAALSSEGGLPLAEPVSNPAPQGQLMVDLDFHRVTVTGRPVSLTAKEWAILRILFNSAGRVVSPRRLLQEVWGPEYGDEADYVRTYIRRLRNKLEPDQRYPQYILLERDIGYRLVLPD